MLLEGRGWWGRSGEVVLQGPRASEACVSVCVHRSVCRHTPVCPWACTCVCVCKCVMAGVYLRACVFAVILCAHVRVGMRVDLGGEEQ